MKYPKNNHLISNKTTLPVMTHTDNSSQGQILLNRTMTRVPNHRKFQHEYAYILLAVVQTSYCLSISQIGLRAEN